MQPLITWVLLGTASLALTLATDTTPLTLWKVFVAYTLGPLAVLAAIVVMVFKLFVEDME